MLLFDVWEQIQKINLPPMNKVNFKEVDKELTGDRGDFFLEVINVTNYKLGTKYLEFNVVNSYDNTEELMNQMYQKEFKRIIEEQGLEFNHYSFAVFAILHELGHVYAYNTYSYEELERLDKIQQEELIRDEKILTEEELQEKYRAYPLEAFADQFALEYISKLLTPITY